MTRVEENEMVINEINKKVNDMQIWTYDETIAFQTSIIATILIDISKSLAVIADKAESEE
jgi:hypothetical protein